MKLLSKLAVASVVIAFLAAQSARAANYTWTDGASNSTWNTTSGDWTTSGTGASIAWSSSNAAIFGTVGAGTITVSGSETITGLTVNANGYSFTGGVINLSGTTTPFVINDGVSITSAIGGADALVKTGSGLLLLAGTNFYSGGTTISSGTLQVGNGGATGGTGSGNIVDNATLIYDIYGGTVGVVISGSGSVVKETTGTLILTGSNTYSGGTTISSGTLQVGNGGTADSTGSGNIVDNGAVIYDIYGGTVGAVISGTGALWQTGAGSVTLSGSNTYTGATIVSGGTLKVAGSLQSPSVTLTSVNNSTLSSGSSGSIVGIVTANSGSFITPGGAGTVGTLTLGGLTMNTGSSLDMDLASSSSYDQILLGSGTLTLGAGTETINLAGSGFTAGNYSLIDYGSLSGSSFTLGSTPGGLFNYAITTGGTSTILTITNQIVQSLIWNTNGAAGLPIKDGSGSWGNGSSNFYSVSTGSATTWNNTAGNSLTIGGTSTGTGGVITLTSSVNVLGTLTFATVASPYTISGSGSNTLILAGGITANNSAAINAPVILSGSQSWNVASSGTLSVGGVISGTSALSKIGAGALALSNSNSYSGGTILSGGVLNYGNVKALGNGLVTFAGSSTLQAGVSGTLANSVAINPGVTGTFDTQAFTSTLSGAISGSGALSKIGAGILTLTNTNSYRGGTTLSGGTVDYANTVALGSSSMTFAGNSTLQAGVSGTLANNVAINPGVTGTFDTQAFTSTLSGVISGSGALSKIGAGTLTLSSSNTYSGATTINAGVLNIPGSLASPTIAVNSGGALSGVGNGSSLGVVTGTVTVAGGGGVDFTKDGQTLTTTTGITTLTLGGLTLTGGTSSSTESYLTFNANTIGTDLIKDNGTLTLTGSGGVIVNINSDGLNNGTYNLLTSQSVSNPFNDTFILGSQPTGPHSYTFSITSGTLQMTVGGFATPKTAYWYGGYQNAGTISTGSLNAWGGYNGTLTNWSSNAAGTTDAGQIPGPSTDVVFTGSNISSGSAISTVVNTPYSINSLTFNSQAGSVNISGSAITINALASGSGGLGYAAGTGIVDNSGTSPVTIASNLVLANNQSWANNSTQSGSTTLTISGGITASGTDTLTLSGSGAGNTNISGSVGKGGGGFAVAVNTTGAGITILSNSNSYSGGTTLSGGVLNYGSVRALGTGLVTFAGNSTLQAGISGTLANTMAINPGVTGTFDTQASAATLSGTIGGTGALSKIGTGTLTLTGTNTYSGGTTISMGTLQVGNGGTAGSTGGGNIVDNGTLVYDLTSGTIGVAISGTGTLSQIGGGGVTLTGSDTYSGGTTIGGGILDLRGSTGSLASGSTSNLSFAGTGVFDYDNAGSSNVGKNQSLNALNFNAGDGTVETTLGSAASASLTFASASRVTGATGDFVVTGGTNVTPNKIVITGQSAGFMGPGLFFGGTNYAYYDSGGYVRGVNYGSDANSIASSGGSNITGGALTASSNVELLGNITGQGAATINTLDMQDYSLALSGTQTLTLNGILEAGGTASISGGDGIVSGGGSDLVVRTNLAGDSLTINTSVSAASLTKSGAGTLTLNDKFNGTVYLDGGSLGIGAGVTVTGNVNLSGGVTQVSGTVAGNVSVGAGSTISGSGNVTGKIVVAKGGSTYPGDPQIFTSGSMEYQDGSTAQFSIATTTSSSHPPTPGVDYDQINLTGGPGQVLQIDPGTTTLQLNLTSTSLAALQANVSDQIIDNYFLFTLGSGTSSGQFSDLTLTEGDNIYTDTITNGVVDFDSLGLEFDIYYTGDSTNDSTFGGNDVDVSVNAVPEPGTWAPLFAGIAGMALLLVRRRNSFP